MRSARMLALALLAAAPLVAAAVDAPHEDGIFCSKCHVGHNAPGASLTKEEGNANLCNSCHQGYAGSFGFPWALQFQAVPGVSGSSHRWDADAANLGATPPSASSSDPDEQEMARRIDGGKLMCSTCHDQHAADTPPVSGRGRQTISTVTRLDASNPGTGMLSVGTVASGATAKSYYVDIVAEGSETDAKFRVSNDNGTSWFGCKGSSWDTYADPVTTGCQAGPTVALDDGTNVYVAFGAGTYAVGDGFTFYVSYPYLRADITISKMCVVCHKDRHMTTANVEGTGTHAGTGAAIIPGTTVFHHPVGATVTVATAPLDANGGASDGDPSNDLTVGAGGEVSCLTCHRVHNADSNSLTPDP